MPRSFLPVYACTTDTSTQPASVSNRIVLASAGTAGTGRGAWTRQCTPWASSCSAARRQAISANSHMAEQTSSSTSLRRRMTRPLSTPSASSRETLKKTLPAASPATPASSTTPFCVLPAAHPLRRMPSSCRPDIFASSPATPSAKASAQSVTGLCPAVSFCPDHGGDAGEHPPLFPEKEADDHPEDRRQPHGGQHGDQSVLPKSHVHSPQPILCPGGAEGAGPPTGR